MAACRFKKFPVLFPVLRESGSECRNDFCRSKAFPFAAACPSLPLPGPTRDVAAQTGHPRVDAACQKAARRRRPKGMIVPLFRRARADLWKRTNFEIPSEINAVRVLCRGGAGGEEAHCSDGLGAGTVSKRSLAHGRRVSFLLGNPASSPRRNTLCYYNYNCIISSLCHSRARAQHANPESISSASVVMGSGFAASRRPGTTPQRVCDAVTLLRPTRPHAPVYAHAPAARRSRSPAPGSPAAPGTTPSASARTAASACRCRRAPA